VLILQGQKTKNGFVYLVYLDDREKEKISWILFKDLKHKILTPPKDVIN
jgi:hypothetical protein